jgi:hypothetical protein
MAAYTTLVPDVNVLVGGCPQPVIVNALQRAAREFFIRTDAYRLSFAPINVVANTSTYTLTLPTDVEVRTVQHATYLGAPLRVVDLATTLDTDRLMAATGAPNTIRFPSWTQAVLHPIPNETVSSALVIAYTAAPTRAAAGLADAIIDRYREGIIAGAAWMLAAQPNVPWRDVDTVKVQLALWNRAITDGMAAGNRGNVGRTSHPQLRRFA